MDQFEMQTETEQQKEQQKKNEERRERRYYLTGILTGLLAAALIAGIVFLVRDVRTNKDQSAQTQAQESDSVVSEAATYKLGVLQDAIEKYYLEDVDAQVLEEGMYAGLLDALGDPYSVYYTAEELQEIYDKTRGVYYGIGAYIGMDTTTGYAVITKLIENTPAAASELQPGDLIYQVEGEDVYGMDTSEIVAKIKGEEGTPVTMTVARASGVGYEYIDVTITRAKINSPTVEFRMLENDIAYIEITEFDDITLEQFNEALAEARGSNMKGLILDLRGNPGGNLTTVVEIAKKILPEGMIVYTEDKYGEREEYVCDGAAPLGLPLVVLIDGNSASASEILAGAIKDYGVGTLVGTTTFGKGIVQRIMQLTDGSAIKLTISKYYTPNGYNIHGIGIAPDVEVPYDAELYRSEDRDNQLEEATRIMNEMLGAAE
ncbi:MAG: S41 family peptidase [Clostridium sp.]|nr:S41 family peptidase [Clostridium sp.]